MKTHVPMSLIVVFFGLALIPGFTVADKPEGAGKPEWVEKEKAEKEEEKAERKAEKKREKAEQEAGRERDKAERGIGDSKDDNDD